MKPNAMIPSHAWPDAGQAVTIRMAGPADAAALSRLAQLDPAPPLDSVPTLVAEVRGELHAALAVESRRAIADPFEPTAKLLAMLVQRAGPLERDAELVAGTRGHKPLGLVAYLLLSRVHRPVSERCARRDLPPGTGSAG
jgi:hypothetical protein